MSVVQHGIRLGVVIAAIVIGPAAVVAGTTAEAPQPGTLAPSEVLHRVRDAIARGPREKQGEIATPLLALARKTSLSAEEDLALGEVYFLALMARPADAIFTKYLDRADRIGRIAWQRHQQILFRARDLHDEAERNIPEFRKRFRPSADDLSYTGPMIANQTSRYADQGNHAKAVALILEDIETLPKDLPLRSFRLLGTRFASFAEVGKAADARALLQAHRDALQARIDAWGPGLVPASEVVKQSYPHRAGVLHADFDVILADDAPDHDPERLATQFAIDRVQEIDELLRKMTPSGPPQSTAVAPAPAPGAQQANTRVVSNSLHRQFVGISRDLTAAAELMPAEKYAFRPSRDARTFGEIIGHLATTQFAVCGLLATGQLPSNPTDFEKISTKATLATALRDSTMLCTSVYAKIADAELSEIVSAPGPTGALQPVAKTVLLIGQFGHANLHYGNVATYLRLNGLVPPSTAGAQPQPPQVPRTGKVEAGPLPSRPPATAPRWSMKTPGHGAVVTPLLLGRPGRS